MMPHEYMAFDALKGRIDELAKELHERVDKTITEFISERNLPEDAITLNIVFNALSFNLRAIIENNKDITEEAVQSMLKLLLYRLRQAYDQNQPHER